VGNLCIPNWNFLQLSVNEYRVQQMDEHGNRSLKSDVHLIGRGLLTENVISMMCRRDET